MEQSMISTKPKVPKEVGETVFNNAMQRMKQREQIALDKKLKLSKDAENQFEKEHQHSRMIKAFKMIIETKEEQAGLSFTRKQKQRMNETFEQSYTPLADSIIIS